MGTNTHTTQHPPPLGLPSVSLSGDAGSSGGGCRLDCFPMRNQTQRREREVGGSGGSRRL
ncbi:hypothetical protein Hdeb2414_s0002g00044701 [Helianthus debilis subsp. tardiflorus]